MQIELQRRHSPDCPDRAKGPHFLKCRGKCKLYAFGYDDDGNRVRDSLKTRDLALAAKRLGKLATSREAGEKSRKLLSEAIAAVEQRHANLASETKRKYTRILTYLAQYCERAGIEFVDQVTVEVMDGYGLERRKTNWTWIKEIEILRQFFSFCVKRKYCETNPAEELKRPRLPESEIVPYSQEEIIRIIAACDQIGRASYERLRARAMVLVLRYAGLRIGDVVTLSREDIQGNYLKKRALKNRRMIQVELPDVVLNALHALPHPKAAPRESQLFFASGNSSIRSLVKGAERALAAVFKRAGVERAHAHRFRHTLASELLGKGETIEVVAEILGDSPNIVRRHYAHWTPEGQSRKDRATRGIHGTDLTQTEGKVVTC